MWLFLVCGLLAYITYHLKVATTPAWTDGTLEAVHARLVAFDYVNNEQSRLLQYGIPEGLIRTTGMAVRTAYKVQRLAFTTLAFLVFFGFLRRWLRPGAALAAVVFHALLICYSARNDLQESAPLLGLTFVAALWALREGRDPLFAGLVWIGSLNNETMLFLPALHFLVHVRTAPPSAIYRPAARALLLGLPALVSVAVIRYLTRELPYLGGGWHLGENIRHFGAVLLFLGPLWFLAFRRFRSLPHLLQRGLLAVPLFLVPNMMVGVITETRLLLPLCSLVLPAALLSLLPEERADLKA